MACIHYQLDINQGDQVKAVLDIMLSQTKTPEAFLDILPESERELATPYFTWQFIKGDSPSWALAHEGTKWTPANDKQLHSIKDDIKSACPELDASSVAFFIAAYDADLADACRVLLNQCRKLHKYFAKRDHHGGIWCRGILLGSDVGACLALLDEDYISHYKTFVNGVDKNALDHETLSLDVTKALVDHWGYTPDVQSLIFTLAKITQGGLSYASSLPNKKEFMACFPTKENRDALWKAFGNIKHIGKEQINTWKEQHDPGCVPKKKPVNDAPLLIDVNGKTIEYLVAPTPIKEAWFTGLLQHAGATVLDEDHDDEADISLVIEREEDDPDNFVTYEQAFDKKAFNKFRKKFNDGLWDLLHEGKWEDVKTKTTGLEFLITAETHSKIMVESCKANAPDDQFQFALDNCKPSGRAFFLLQLMGIHGFNETKLKTFLERHAFKISDKDYDWAIETSQSKNDESTHKIVVAMLKSAFGR